MDLWMSRWLGERLVNTAMSGLVWSVISWKEDSSNTATSSGDISPASDSNGLPMLPPRWTVYPAFFSISEIRVVVVVFPSLPVTAMILQGQTWKKTSISEVSTLPFSMAARKGGISGRIPGERKIIS